MSVKTESPEGDWSQYLKMHIFFQTVVIKMDDKFCYTVEGAMTVVFFYFLDYIKNWKNLHCRNA